MGSITATAASSTSTASTATTASATATTVTATATSGSADNWLLSILFELISPLGKWRLDDFSLAPKVWSEVLVSLRESLEGSFDKVLSSSGMTRGTCVAVINTSELKELLRDWSTNNTGTTGSWDKLDSN